MLLDLFAIIFIIILSFVLCYKDNNYKCQISHIILGISVIVFYKLSKYLQLQNIVKTYNTKENFVDKATTDLINEFLGNNPQSNMLLTPEQARTMSSSDLIAYNKKLDEIITGINNLNNNMTQGSQSSSTITSGPIGSKLDLQAQQQYQLFVIDQLNNQLKNAKEIINSQAVANVSSNYKPIKVYSSCVISNANGTNTIQQFPVNSSSSNNPNNPTNQLLQTSSQSDPNSPIGPALLTGQSSQFQNIGYHNNNNTTTNNNNFVNLKPSTGFLGDLVNKAFSGNSEINLNII